MWVCSVSCSNKWDFNTLSLCDSSLIIYESVAQSISEIEQLYVVDQHSPLYCWKSKEGESFLLWEELHEFFKNSVDSDVVDHGF